MRHFFKVLLTGFMFFLINGIGNATLRQPTPEEIEFSIRTQKAFASVIPAVPAGWEVVDKGDFSPPSVVAEKAENFPLNVSFFFRAEDVGLKSKMESQMAAELGKSIPATREKLEKIMEAAKPKMEALAAKMQSAAERGDMSEVQRLLKELEALQAPLSQESQASNESVEKGFQLPIDFDCRYEIMINSDIQGEVQDCRKEPSIGGNPVFWATDDQPKTIGHPLEGMFYAFLGPVECKLTGNALLVSPGRKMKIPHLGMGYITVTVAGTYKRARKVMEAIDWRKLKTLLAR
ncbi:MAG: ABC transporter C-terminal domain-containing protein [Candidatus Ozemobacteraceae bacterium]